MAGNRLDEEDRRMKLTRVVTAMAAAGMLALGAPMDATAQAPVPQEQEAIEITDELLDRFVAVYPAVVEVAQAAQVELASAETAEEAQAIQADAQTRVTGALEEGDMSVEEYEAVVTRLNDDPELMAEIQERLEEQEQNGGPTG